MAKYDPLRGHLLLSGQRRMTMSFDQVAALVGPLPRSAYDHQAWWANEQQGQHVQADAWRSAGYVVESFNLMGRTVTFAKSG